jgi:hypothetical protein
MVGVCCGSEMCDFSAVNEWYENMAVASNCLHIPLDKNNL